MTTFIKVNLKRLDDQTNIDKHRVAADIAEYQNIVSKLIFIDITLIIPKFMMKRQLLR